MFPGIPGIPAFKTECSLPFIFFGSGIHLLMNGVIVVWTNGTMNYI